MRKILSLLLALAMTMSLAAMPAVAAETAVETVAVTAVQSRRIVGFAPFDVSEHALYVSAENRPAEEKLVERMPTTLTVLLDSGECVELPVEWYCITEDYAEERYYHYQFSPKWDESAYELDESIDLYTEAPYISVSMVNEDSSEISPLGLVDGSKKPNEKLYERQTFLFLTKTMGLKTAQACGIMANIYAECAFKPDNLQGYYEKTLKHTDDSYTAAVDDGTYRYSSKTNARDSFTRDSAGYGIVQWTWWERKRNFYDFAKSKNASIGDLAMQLQFMKKELDEDYISMVKTIKGYANTSTGAYNTASKFCEKYEQPSQLEARMKERGNYGKQYWEEYKNGLGDINVPALVMKHLNPLNSILSFTPPANSFLTEYFFEYTGTAHEPEIDASMTDAEDYAVVYENNVNAGLGVVKLMGQDKKELDYCQFLIAQRDISKAAMTLAYSSVHYTGTARNVAVTVKDTLSGKTVTLVKGKDYIVTYRNNVNVGTATAVVQGIGNYRGQLSKTFKISPKMTAVSSASSKKTRKLTVKWEKNTTCKGYQIQVATDSKFTKNLKKKTVTSYKTTSYTFSSLKKKTKYYVRMRTYKKVDGVTYYSGWTVYGKTVKTK